MSIEKSNKEDWEDSGLSREHWHELNKSAADSSLDYKIEFPSPERYDELRKFYSDNPRALLAIDQFDPDSEWKIRFNEAKEDALKSRNTEKIEKFHDWEKEKYPDVFK